MKRPIVGIVLVLAACTQRATPTADPAAGSDQPSRPQQPPVAGAPAASMSSGTAFVDGVLAAWCTGKSCKPGTAARPKFVPGDDNGVVLFELGARPDAARVEVHTSAGALVARGEMLPGTTMAYQTKLGDGRFIFTLYARWGNREGRWLFGVDGPLGGTKR
ncbi:MAG: hypothetical protein ABR552_03660 [Actinomycetota bacterium]